MNRLASLVARSSTRALAGGLGCARGTGLCSLRHALRSAPATGVVAAGVVARPTALPALRVARRFGGSVTRRHRPAARAVKKTAKSVGRRPVRKTAARQKVEAASSRTTPAGRRATKKPALGKTRPKTKKPTTVRKRAGLSPHQKQTIKYNKRVEAITRLWKEQRAVAPTGSGATPSPWKGGTR